MNRLINIIVIALLLPIALQAQSNRKVAIVQPQGVASDLHKSIVRGSLRDAIAAVDGYEAFTRTDIDELMKEYQFQQGGMVSDAQRTRMGRMDGVDMICAIQVTTDEGYLFVESQIIELQSGRVHKSESELMEAAPPKIRDGCIQLAAKLVGAGGGSAGGTAQRTNEEVLSMATQNLLKSVPKNSRILITGITGTNDIQPQYIQSMISKEAIGMIGMTVILDEQRQVANRAHLVGANFIITGGVFGNGDTRRIVFRVLDVETAQIVSETCILFRQTNSEFINNVERLIQKFNYSLNNSISNGSSIVIVNNIGTNRDADFVYDMIESNLVNQFRYKIVARSKEDNQLIRKEHDFQMSGHVSSDTVVRLGKFIGAEYLLQISSAGTKIEVKILDIESGSTIAQELL